MRFIYVAPVFLSLLFLTGCCPDGVFPFDETLCADQVFKESKVVPLNFTYTVNTDKKFLEAKNVNSGDIQKALNVDGDNFTITNMELTSATFSYSKFNDNSSAAVFVNLAVVDNTNQLYALLAQDKLLPLFDLPATLFTPELNINKLLNENGVQELSRIMKEYFASLNNQGVGFLLIGEPSPKGTFTHFDIKVKMTVSIEYEVCRFVPLGTGIRICE